MQKSLASSLNHHVRLLHDITTLSSFLSQDETLITLLTDITLPNPVELPPLLSDCQLDLTAVSDSLAMARHEHFKVTRKLRAVRDAWMERKDMWDMIDDKILWLSEHDSQDRRAPGSCAREVRGVMQGFDQVLGQMELAMYDSR